MTKIERAKLNLQTALIEFSIGVGEGDDYAEAFLDLDKKKLDEAYTVYQNLLKERAEIEGHKGAERMAEDMI